MWFLHRVYIYQNIKLCTSNYEIFICLWYHKKSGKSKRYSSIPEKWRWEKLVLLSVKRNLYQSHKSTWVKRWRTVLWIHKVCSLMCHFVTGLTLLIFRLGNNPLFLWYDSSTMWNTYGLWNSEVKASFYFFFSPSIRTIICIWKYNVNFTRFSAVVFVIFFFFFIPERLINEGNGRESEPLNTSTVYCHCLNSSWIWSYERDLMKE